MEWRPEMRVEEIGSPQRIAPYAFAIAAEVTADGEDLGTGRLILLHDPIGNEAWDGAFRCVAYAKAEIDLDMISDPLLSDVGWSWLSDALDSQDATHGRPAGTVTSVYSKSFGAIDNAADRADLEIRASWTPVLDEEHPFTCHLAAWQQLVCQFAGLQPLPSGVVPFFQRPGKRT